MLVKWGVGGLLVGAVAGAATGTDPASGAVFGAIVAVALRKWIFGSFWM